VEVYIQDQHQNVLVLCKWSGYARLKCVPAKCVPGEEKSYVKQMLFKCKNCNNKFVVQLKQKDLQYNKEDKNFQDR